MKPPFILVPPGHPLHEGCVVNVSPHVDLGGQELIITFDAGRTVARLDWNRGGGLASSLFPSKYIHLSFPRQLPDTREPVRR